jgi:lipooligosaccharide transport system ATP-binding protein
MNSSPSLVEARKLKKSFGNLIAVDEISFGVSKGLCFGILGPNGAGKTSAIRMIYGASPITSGDLFVFGLDVKTSAPLIKSRIGVCQQENTLDPDLTIMQNFEVFSRCFDIDKKTARRRALELLKFLALEQRRDARVTELSGGMVRRLIIARALINRPQLIILDEPTTGIDP